MGLHQIQVKAAIQSRFRVYRDFVPFAGDLSENEISKVITDRKKLTKKQAQIWANALGIPAERLDPLTDEGQE